MVLKEMLTVSSSPNLDFDMGNDNGENIALKHY